MIPHNNNNNNNFNLNNLCKDSRQRRQLQQPYRNLFKNSFHPHHRHRRRHHHHNFSHHHHYRHNSNHNQCKNLLKVSFHRGR